MSSSPEWVLHHIEAARDELLKARKEAVELIVSRIEGEREPPEDAALTKALEDAVIRTRQACRKLWRMHPDGESLPIERWSRFAALGKRQLPEGQEMEPAAETVRIVRQGNAEIEQEIQKRLAAVIPVAPAPPPWCEDDIPDRQATLRRLLAYVWRRRPRAEVRGVCDHVWGDEDHLRRHPQALRSLLHKANAFIEPFGHTLSREGRHVVLS
jgi:hypothetical protein